MTKSKYNYFWCKSRTFEDRLASAVSKSALGFVPLLPNFHPAGSKGAVVIYANNSHHLLTFTVTVTTRHQLQDARLQDVIAIGRQAGYSRSGMVKG